MFNSRKKKMPLIIGKSIAMVIALFAVVTLLFSCAPHSHSYEDWKVLSEATCNNSGLEEGTCSCGETSTRIIEAKGHLKVTDSAVAPTCSTTGLTEGAHCSECGETLISQMVMPVRSHELARVDLVMAQDKIEEHLKCTNCGKTEVKESSFDTETPVTITFYHAMGATLRDTLDVYIEEFRKLFPNIQVEHKQIGGYDDVGERILHELATGTQPNIAYAYPDNVADYLPSGKVMALDPFINCKVEVTHADGSTEYLGLTQAQIDDFIEAFYNEGRVFGDDQMYTLPMSKASDVLYYNKTFFDQYGLKVPETWDELEAICARIKEIDPDCIPLSCDTESNWFITMCEQLGSPYTSATGDHILFDNEINREFVKQFADWYAKGYVTTADIYGSYSSSLFTATSGTRSYMCIASSSAAVYHRPERDMNGEYLFEVGIVTVPQMDLNNRKVIMCQGPSLVMFDSGDIQEDIATWLFMKFLTTNTDFQADFSMRSNGYMPVIKSALDEPIYKEFLEHADGGNCIQMLSTKVCLEQESFYFSSPAFLGSADVRSRVKILMQECFIKVRSMRESGSTEVEIDAEIKRLFGEAVDDCRYYQFYI